MLLGNTQCNLLPINNNWRKFKTPDKILIDIPKPISHKYHWKLKYFNTSINYYLRKWVKEQEEEDLEIPHSWSSAELAPAQGENLKRFVCFF